MAAPRFLSVKKRDTVVVGGMRPRVEIDTEAVDVVIVKVLTLMRPEMLRLKISTLRFDFIDDYGKSS